MRPRAIHFGVAAFVLRRNVGDMVGEFDQFFAAVIRLLDDALPRFGDVMLESNHILKAQRFANLRRDLDRLVVGRVAPIETDERRRAIIAGKQLRADESPQTGVRIVVAHEHRNFKFNINAESVEQVTHQHRAGIDIENLAHAVVGVVMKQLVCPHERVIIGLPNAAEVAGDRCGSVEMNVRSIGAFGVERLHITRADDLHGGSNRR